MRREGQGDSDVTVRSKYQTLFLQFLSCLRHISPILLQIYRLLFYLCIS